MSKIDLQTLSFLSTKGVEFCVSVPTESGQTTYMATADDLLLLVDNPAALYAKANGVTKAEYRDWQDDDCAAFCAANTKAGKRCRNHVRGGFQVSAKEWLNLQGKYCLVHGD